MSDAGFFQGRFRAPDPQKAGDVRTPYERDLGRIVHSAAFRRLQGKTQVMGVGEGDFHRTRLTHSIECAQIGTGLVDQLQRSGLLVGDLQAWQPPRPLIEAACVAHDLGHPPFGHAGEAALHAVMATHGGFEGNGHTLRILSRLEKYKEPGWGINPTRRLILAVLKYPVPYSAFPPELVALKPPKCYFDEEADVVDWAIEGFGQDELDRLRERDARNKARHRTFDCSLVELADDIAYGVHDIEDIVARRLVDRDRLQAVMDRTFDVLGGSLDTHEGRLDGAQVVAGLFGSSYTRKQMASALVSVFITAARVDQIDGFSHPLLRHRVGLPDAHARLLEGLRALSFELVIHKAPIQQLTRRGAMVVTQVFKALLEDPAHLLPDGSWDDGVSDGGPERRVCDYVAGMTDRYAERVYKRLFVTGFGSSSDTL